MSGNRDDFDLDGLLAEAALHPAAPSGALMARILADGLALQPKPAPALPVAVRAAAPRRGLWSRLAEGFGGRGALVGMGAAAVLGLYVGYTDPGGVTALLMQSSDGGLEMVPAAEMFLTGG